MKKLYAVFILFFSLHAMAAPPTVPASNLNFPAVDGGFFNMAWTAGNGVKRMIVCRAGSPVSFRPQNGADYSENTVFGSGQQVAPGEFVVYDNAFTSFFLTNLSPATQYFFAVFEYNGSGTGTEYLVNNFLSGSASTSGVPAQQVSAADFLNITANAVTVSWTNGNGQRRLIVARAGTAVNADPVMGHQYAVNSVFGTGEAIGAGNFTVYASTGNSTTITNLQPNTQYFFSFYEFNGNGQPQYRIPAFTTSVTTRSMPTVASSNFIVTRADGKQVDLAWTNGNGQRRIIVAKQGSAVTSQPVNGIDYAASAIFGQGQQLATGEFVVFDDNFNATAVTGLNPATVYFFKIFEYDGTGSNTLYLTSAFAAVSATTAARPTLQVSNVSVTNVTGNSLHLSFTPGNGRARMIVAHKNSAVNVPVQDFTVYTGNNDFGQGQDLGSGNFVMANTTDMVLAIDNLEPNTTYHFAVFEFNGFNQPLYLSPAAVFQATTLGAVPVALLSWQGRPVQDKVLLHWSTSTEVNSGYFIVERGVDGEHFTALTTVAAAGNSSIEKHYNSEDASPLPGRSYYRLKMVDNDGRINYSHVLVIEFSLKLQPVIRSANPVQNVLVLSNLEKAVMKDWQLINVAGQPVKVGKTTGETVSIDVTTLPPGTYWLRIYSKGRKEVVAFIKQ